MSKSKGIDFYVERALIFVLGVLVGVAIKVEAGKVITVGYDDYKMKFSSNQYSINELQKKFNEKVAQEEKENSDNNQNVEQNNNQEQGSDQQNIPIN